MDFDTRVHTLTVPIDENWPEDHKARWRENQQQTIDGLQRQFGMQNIEAKMRDFIAMGPRPFSLIGYHNAFFQQIRAAFTSGAYYPALTGACALGERILNHLLIDLRDEFRTTPEYKRIYRKSSFDDWKVPIETLTKWDILLPDAERSFRQLHELRNRSIHFNSSTYQTLRNDALAAIAHIGVIVERQFGWFGTQPWFIEGTAGASFIKRDFETHPFVKRFILPQCPCVGIACGIAPNFHIDFDDYGDGDLTDEEFRDAYNNRDPKSVAGRHL